MARIAYDKFAPVPFGPEKNGLYVHGGTVGLLTGDLALNAVTALFKVPAKFTLVDMKGKVADLDGGAALVFSLGDADTAGRLLSGATTGQAGGALGALAVGGIGYRFAAETEILFTATTAAGTPAAGNITLFLIGFYD
jgi:hypothetical protein